MSHDEGISYRDALRELTEISGDLAQIQDQLAGPRMARRNVRARIASECVKTAFDEEAGKGTVVSWRPPSPEEVAEIDSVHEATAPILRELEPIERALRAAKRVAEIDLKQAAKSGAKRRKTGAQMAQKERASCSEPPTGNGAMARHFPPAQNRRRNGARAAPGVGSSGAAQMPLFGEDQ